MSAYGSKSSYISCWDFHKKIRGMGTGSRLFEPPQTSMKLWPPQPGGAHQRSWSRKRSIWIVWSPDFHWHFVVTAGQLCWTLLLSYVIMHFWLFPRLTLKYPGHSRTKSPTGISPAILVSASRTSRIGPSCPIPARAQLVQALVGQSLKRIVISSEKMWKRLWKGLWTKYNENLCFHHFHLRIFTVPLQESSPCRIGMALWCTRPPCTRREHTIVSHVYVGSRGFQARDLNSYTTPFSVLSPLLSTNVNV